MDKDGGLRKLIKDHIPEAHWTNVETSAITSGAPDLEGCLNATQIWVECKRTNGWTVEIRPAQRGWIMARTAHGGRVWIAVRQLGKDRDNLWIVPGRHVRTLGDCGLRGFDPIVFHDSGGPRNWSWEILKHVLFSNSQYDLVSV